MNEDKVIYSNDRSRYYLHINKNKQYAIICAVIAVVLLGILIVLGNTAPQGSEGVLAGLSIALIASVIFFVFYLYIYIDAKNIIDKGGIGVGYYISTRTIVQKNRSVYKIRFKYVARGQNERAYNVENKYYTYNAAEAAMVSAAQRFRIAYLEGKAIIVETPWEISKRQPLPDQDKEYQKVYKMMSAQSSMKEIRQLVAEHEINMSLGTREKIEQQIPVILLNKEKSAGKTEQMKQTENVWERPADFGKPEPPKAITPPPASAPSQRGMLDKPEPPKATYQNIELPKSSYERTEPPKAVAPPSAVTPPQAGIFDKPEPPKTSFSFGSGFGDLKFGSSGFDKPDYAYKQESAESGGDKTDDIVN